MSMASRDADLPARPRSVILRPRTTVSANPGDPPRKVNQRPLLPSTRIGTIASTKKKDAETSGKHSGPSNTES